MSVTTIIRDSKPYGDTKLDYGYGRFVSGVVHGYYLARDMHKPDEPMIGLDRFENAARKYLVLRATRTDIISVAEDVARVLPKLYDIILRADELSRLAKCH